MMVQGAGGQLQSPSGPGGSSPALPQGPDTTAATPHSRRKRKAESQDNERLSKRLSLLNLEHNGSKLYVPVETPSAGPDPTSLSQPPTLPHPPRDDSMQMQLDDSRHKVYIYNIDDELSSDSEGEDGKLIFLPDIDKHLRENRIPPHILANGDGELAGMQMVLYSDPKSLTVPESRDSVRKAVIEARHRVRERQRQERDGTAPQDNAPQDNAPQDTTSINKMSQTQAMELQDDGDAMDMDIDMD
ncbi:hypothetical protein TOPH_04058 [Tolypocladium ophioglossoides CBS 100239]|uniref:Uncharacterized protein n=1 Tax=Tolypocladium ophioglossoides (strain CBS 100239) TaxID=1163406 RepID=A0A0L0NBF3_TOLOC|nr:hypothetical protein TOPH_04058 [Tolypocladium ophioglossoides CBS 100239]